MKLELSLRMEFQGCNEDATELHVNGEVGAENAEFSEMLDRLESVATTDGECLDGTDWNASLRWLPVILERMLWRSDVRRV
jgi:hypothetical protein